MHNKIGINFLFCVFKSTVKFNFKSKMKGP